MLRGRISRVDSYVVQMNSWGKWRRVALLKRVQRKNDSKGFHVVIRCKTELYHITYVVALQDAQTSAGQTVDCVHADRCAMLRRFSCLRPPVRNAGIMHGAVRTVAIKTYGFTKCEFFFTNRSGSRG